MLEGLVAVLAFILAMFVMAGLLWAFVSFLSFLVSLIGLPFSIAGMIVSVVQQKRGMGESGKTIALRALLVGAVGAIAFAAAAFFLGAPAIHIGIAALAGLFIGAVFGL